MTLGADVAAALEAAGVGTQGVDIWVGPIPDFSGVTEPAIGIIEDPGVQPDYVMGGQAQPEIERPGLGLEVRGTPAKTDPTAYPTARAKIDLAWRTVNGLEISGYLTFIAQGSAWFREYDTDTRPRFAAAFGVMKDGS